MLQVVCLILCDQCDHNWCEGCFVEEQSGLLLVCMLAYDAHGISIQLVT